MPSWKNIPIPPLVNRLPRSSSGMPVPWNASWGPEQERVEVVPETGPTLTCTCHPGQGTPVFGDQCPARQRTAMLERRCSVCGQAIKPTSQLVFIAFTSCSPAFCEPPTHPRCMAYAVRACPRLAEEAPSADLFLTRNFELMEARYGAPSPQFFPLGAPEAKHAGVLHFYFAVPITPRIVTVSSWLEAEAPALTRT